MVTSEDRSSHSSEILNHTYTQYHVWDAPLAKCFFILGQLKGVSPPLSGGLRENGEENELLRWTEKELQLLRELWDDPNITPRDMTKVLKSRSADAIKMKAKHLGLPPHSTRRKPEIDLEYYKQLMEVKEG